MSSWHSNDRIFMTKCQKNWIDATQLGMKYSHPNYSTIHVSGRVDRMAWGIYFRFSPGKKMCALSAISGTHSYVKWKSNFQEPWYILFTLFNVLCLWGKPSRATQPGDEPNTATACICIADRFVPILFFPIRHIVVTVSVVRRHAHRDSLTIPHMYCVEVSNENVVYSFDAKRLLWTTDSQFE